MMEPIQISFFGATNSGKSSLVNAIAGQSVSLVSDLPGTTTDPVRKRMEIPGIGPCVLVDTAGYGDKGELGSQRERLTKAVIDSTHIAVLIRSGHPADSEWESMLTSAGIPVVPITQGADRDAVLEQITSSFQKEQETFLTGSLVKKGDVVVLVMPQDSEAPGGRIILPQVQVLRELLDRACIPVCCLPEQLSKTLESLKEPPALVITDSQVFRQVNDMIPTGWPLTSFSVLLAAAKGDIRIFSEGAKAIDKLRERDRILIAEACTHVPNTEDIGRVKIPALLRKRIPGLQVTVAGGKDFPEDLSDYNLIIHCGACVASARLVKSRIKKALQAGVPITNYGIAIAYLQGILERISFP